MMNRHTLSLGMMSALMLAACSTDGADNSDNRQQPLGDAIRLSSGIVVKEPETRAATNLLVGSFTADDVVKVTFSGAVNATGAAVTATYWQGVASTTDAMTQVVNSVANLSGTWSSVEADGNTAAKATYKPYYPATLTGAVDVSAVYPPSVDLTDYKTLTANFSVQTDQTTDAAYKASDLMYSAQTSITRSTEARPLTAFAHKLSKIVVNVVSGTGAPTVSDATVLLHNVCPTADHTDLEGAFTTATGTATTIAMSADGAAIIPPQTIAQNATFIGITLNGTATELEYHITAAGGQTFLPGMQYTYTVTVNLQGITVSSSITPWDAGDVAAYESSKTL